MRPSANYEKAQAQKSHRRLTARLGLALLLLVPLGCGKGQKPGVRYSVALITRGPTGTVTPQEPATSVKSTSAEAGQELAYGGQTYSVTIRKTQYGKATFDIIFPDQRTERVQVKVGHSRDVLPKGQNVGVRIELQESH